MGPGHPRGIWPKVPAGDLGAIDRLVRLLERRAKLLGLDAPVDVAVNQATVDEAEALLADLERSFNALIVERNQYRSGLRHGPEGNGGAPDHPLIEQHRIPFPSRAYRS